MVNKPASTPAASPASKDDGTPHPREGFEKLRPFENSELVIGLIAPVGTDLDVVRKTLCEELKKTGYDVNIIRMTQQVIPEAANIVDVSNNDYGTHLETLMNAGDEARRQAGDNGILALGATKILGGYRVLSGNTQSRRAYIISALKHPDEVETLRMIYPQGFYLIAVHEDPDARLSRLIEKNVPKNQAEALIERDKDGHAPYGQRVEKAFHLADFFVRVHAQDRQNTGLRSSLRRVIDLLFGHPYLTPTFDEYAMFMAFAASLRSADLSRQVGAVVTNNREILSMGANDCPKFGGGLYWPEFNSATGRVEDVPDGRDYMRGGDSNAVERREIMDGVLRLVQNLTQDAEKIDEFAKALAKSRIRDLTEYGRVVHAEMEALLSCTRKGVTTAGGTLYGTTYPCHNCAKHIIAAGIKRVVFIEPYSKSKALAFHKEALQEGFLEAHPRPSKVLLEPFVGIGPRRFFDLFSMNLGSGTPIHRKDETSGKSVQFKLELARLRLQMLPHSYREVEREATAAFEQHCREAKGNQDEGPIGESTAKHT